MKTQSTLDAPRDTETKVRIIQEEILPPSPQHEYRSLWNLFYEGKKIAEFTHQHNVNPGDITQSYTHTLSQQAHEILEDLGLNVSREEITIVISSKKQQ